MKLLICLSSNELTLVAVEKLQVLRRIDLPLPFQETELNALLGTLPAGIQAELLVDLIDEDRFSQSVASVMPWEQGPLLKRILRRRKGADALLYTRWVGGQKNAEGRREKTVQVVGLAETEELERLLDALLERQVRVAHIYSLSELLSDLCIPKRRRKKKDESVAELILVRTGRQTYRQTLVLDGVTRLSRQVQLSEDSAAELAQEQSGFERFLMVQRLVPFGQTFRYTLIGWDTAELERLRQACNLDGQSAVTELQVSQKLAGQAALLMNSPALGWLLQKMTRLPASHFQLPAWQQMRKQHLLRRGMMLTSLVLIIGSVLSSVNLAVRTWNHQQVLLEMRSRQTDYTRQAMVNEARADLPAMAADVRDSTEFVEAVLEERNLPGLQGELIKLSQALRRYPEIVVKRFEWRRPDLAMLDQQQLLLKMSLTPDADTSLDWLRARLASLESTLQAIDAVDSVVRSELPIDADIETDLSVNLDQQTQASYEFDITIGLTHETAPN